MPSSCCVPGCKSPLGTKQHSFPSNLELRIKWVVAIGREDLLKRDWTKIRKSYRLCTFHFSADQKFPDCNNRSTLKHGVVPTQRLPPRSNNNVTVAETSSPPITVGFSTNEHDCVKKPVESDCINNTVDSVCLNSTNKTDCINNAVETNCEISRIKIECNRSTLKHGVVPSQRFAPRTNNNVTAEETSSPPRTVDFSANKRDCINKPIKPERINNTIDLACFNSTNETNCINNTIETDCEISRIESEEANKQATSVPVDPEDDDGVRKTLTNKNKARRKKRPTIKDYFKLEDMCRLLETENKLLKIKLK